MGCTKSKQITQIREPKAVAPETCETNRGDESVKPHFSKKKQIHKMINVNVNKLETIVSKDK